MCLVEHYFYYYLIFVFGLIKNEWKWNPWLYTFIGQMGGIEFIFFNETQ